MFFGGCVSPPSSGCTDSHQRLDHMEQMPEEIRRLHQQRACPSSSYDDNMPHTWQKCPGKRRLGASLQQDVPCFSDCTVQYVIDRNLSSHLADKDTADNLRDADMSDMIGNSRPRKQPRLDMVLFFTVASGMLRTLLQVSDPSWICNGCNVSLSTSPSRGHISKTEQDRPIVSIEHYWGS